MTSDLQIVKIRDHLDLLKDGHHTLPERVAEGIPLLSAKDISYGIKVNKSNATFISKEDFINYHKKWEIKTGDVLVTVVGTIGRTAIVQDKDHPFTLQRSVGILRPGKSFTSEFLFYWLNSKEGQWQLNSRNTGSVQACVFLRDLGDLRIPLFSLKQQHFIKELLQPIDKLIQSLKDESTTLVEITSTLFKSWFIDFDPVKAKAEGIQPFGEDEETTEIFPDSFEESRLGPIPAGWKVGNMSEHCESIHKMVDGPFGSNLKSSDYTDSGVRLIHQENVSEFRFNNSRIRYTSESKSNELSRHSAIPGDLVLTKMPEPICRAAVVPNIAEKFTIMADIIRIRPNPNLPISYLLHLVNSKQFRNKSEAWASGSTRERVTLGTFRTIPTVIPCQTVLVAFGKKCNPLVEQTLLNEQKISTLQRLRDTLLPRLMSCELNVESLEN